MQKKGLSTIITNVLLILLAIAVISSLWYVVNKFIGENIGQEKQVELNCIRDVQIDILDVCYTNTLFNINIKNKREIILGDFFLIELFYKDGTSETIPTAYHTSIEGYGTKQIIIPYYENVEKMKVIPRIESQAYLCYQSAPEFKNIGECK